jgi:hypothetical protein
MSGSGSAVFGLFQKQSDAARAVERLSGSGWRVVPTESLGREEYARLSRPRPVRDVGPRQPSRRRVAVK